MSLHSHPSFDERVLDQSEKIVHQSSPVSSCGIPAYNGIPSYPLSPLPPSPAPRSPSPHRRNGSIIKNHRRTPSFVKAASGYTLRERSGPSQGKWVFIVNGTKIKQWHELCPKLLKQLSSVEVRMMDHFAHLLPPSTPQPLNQPHSTIVVESVHHPIPRTRPKTSRKSLPQERRPRCRGRWRRLTQ